MGKNRFYRPGVELGPLVPSEHAPGPRGVDAGVQVRAVPVRAVSVRKRAGYAPGRGAVRKRAGYAPGRGAVRKRAGNAPRGGDAAGAALPERQSAEVSRQRCLPDSSLAPQRRLVLISWHRNP